MKCRCAWIRPATISKVVKLTSSHLLQQLQLMAAQATVQVILAAQQITVPDQTNPATHNKSTWTYSCVSTRTRSASTAPTNTRDRLKAPMAPLAFAKQQRMPGKQSICNNQRRGTRLASLRPQRTRATIKSCSNSNSSRISKGIWQALLRRMLIFWMGLICRPSFNSKYWWSLIIRQSSRPVLRVEIHPEHQLITMTLVVIMAQLMDRKKQTISSKSRVLSLTSCLVLQSKAKVSIWMECKSRKSWFWRSFSRDKRQAHPLAALAITTIRHLTSN